MKLLIPDRDMTAVLCNASDTTWKWLGEMRTSDLLVVEVLEADEQLHNDSVQQMIC